MKLIIGILLVLLGIYILIGVIFAIFFVTRGLGVLDKEAKDSKWGFRLLLFPGSVALWMILLPKWLKAKKS